MQLFRANKLMKHSLLQNATPHVEDKTKVNSQRLSAFVWNEIHIKMHFQSHCSVLPTSYVVKYAESESEIRKVP